MADQAQRERHRRPAAVRRDGDNSGQAERLAVTPSDEKAADLWARRAVVHQRPADHDTFIKARARIDRAREQRHVELSSNDRPPIPPVWIDGVDPLHPHATLARQDHPVEPQSSLFDPVGKAEALEDGQRAGVQRVTAELVPWKPRTVNDHHARAGTGEDGSCDRAGQDRRPR